MARQRRANGEGGITRRKDGSWMARYSIQTASGRKRKVIYAGSHEEARRKLTEAIAERDKGLTCDSGNVTVESTWAAGLRTRCEGASRSRRTQAMRGS